MFVRQFDPSKVKKPKLFRPLSEILDPKYQGPLDLEIGCGVGWHPIVYAKNNPDRTLIAIERTQEKFQKFQRRFLANHSPVNLLPIHADAVAWITHAVPKNTFDKMIIPYPNPYPKNPAQRWVRMPFFRYLLDVLKEGGEIEIFTNIDSYRHEVVSFLTQYWGLRLVQNRPFDRNDQNGVYRTHFEKKYLERGETCYEIRFQKV